ncbi:hypothetical protein COOONC_18213 [Cooperia oncophora]
MNECRVIVRMLFAVIALSLLLVNVGAEPECLTYHALGGLYKEFNMRYINPDLEYDPTLIHDACDEAKNPGTTTIPNKFTGERTFSSSSRPSLESKVRLALMAGLKEKGQLNRVSPFSSKKNNNSVLRIPISKISFWTNVFCFSSISG